MKSQGELDFIKDVGKIELAIPVELVFDDEPIGDVLAGKSTMQPTPANALERWRLGIDRSEHVARAVAAIIANDPSNLESVGPLDDIEACLHKALDSASKIERGCALVTALGMLAQSQDRVQEAEGYFREARESASAALGPGHPETFKATEHLIQFLNQKGCVDEAKRLLNSMQIEKLMHQPGQMQALRQAALDRFLEGDFAEAERIYNHLVQHGYQLASTHCHLARLYLMTDREEDAAKEADLAWHHLRSAPGYVRPRILFLRLLVQMLGGREKSEGLLRQIQRALSAPGAHEVWTMQPVIDRLAPRLGKEQVALLERLVEALSHAAKVPELYVLPV